MSDVYGNISGTPAELPANAHGCYARLVDEHGQPMRAELTPIPPDAIVMPDGWRYDPATGEATQVEP